MMDVDTNQSQSHVIFIRDTATRKQGFLTVIIISQADLNVVGKNVSSNVSDHEGPSSVNNI